MTLRTSSIEVCEEILQLYKVSDFDYRFSWKDLGFRYFITFTV